MPVLVYFIAFLGAYLLGSIPAGFLAGKLCGIDLREAGSGNIGATNALRVLGKGWGYTVFAFDFLKGFCAAKFAPLLAGSGQPEWVGVYLGLVASVGVVLGHNFPVWLGFRGGKGIATSGGVMLGFFPPVVFGFGLVCWVVGFFTTRFVSVGSLASAVSFPVSTGLLWAFGKAPLAIFLAASLLCAIAILRHVPNIRRLAAGTEKRFEGKKKESPTDPPTA